MRMTALNVNIDSSASDAILQHQYAYSLSNFIRIKCDAEDCSSCFFSLSLKIKIFPL